MPKPKPEFGTIDGWKSGLVDLQIVPLICGTCGKAVGPAFKYKYDPLMFRTTYKCEECKGDIGG